MHEVLLAATDIAYYDYADRFEGDPTLNNLTTVICFACKNLAIFATRNPKNQELLFDRIGDLFERLERGRAVPSDFMDKLEARVVELVCEIFSDNEDLCNKADEELFGTMADLMSKHKHKLRFLRFFQVSHCASLDLFKRVPKRTGDLHSECLDSKSVERTL